MKRIIKMVGIIAIAVIGFSITACPDPVSSVDSYLVTVNGGTGGGNYAQGATVTITAEPTGGQTFTNWTINSGGITLSNANSTSTTFTMPANAVTVTANFVSGDGTPQQQADAFKSVHSAILEKTVETVTLDDEAAVDAALTTFTALSQDVKDLLGTEKSLLDSLSVKINELKASATPQELANAFKTGYSAILSKTVDTVTIDDEAAVDAALTAFATLAQGVKDLLGTEKTLLDNLKTKINDLKAANLTYTISGTITADKPAGPLAGASVTLKQSGATIDTTTSAGNGTYTFSDVSNSTYSIEVSRSGYHTNTIPEVIVSGGNVSGQDLTLYDSTVPAHIVSIKITTLPDKLHYLANSGADITELELDGMVLTATKSDGSTEPLPVSPYTLMGGNVGSALFQWNGTDYDFSGISTFGNATAMEGITRVAVVHEVDGTLLYDIFQVLIVDRYRLWMELEITLPVKTIYSPGESLDH